jgi:hypothetical protein
MAATNPHYTPGMGFAKNAPPPPRALSEVRATVSLGDVTLKLTLTLRFLTRPLRDALVEPFLKAYNKRCPDTSVAWEQIACIQIDGETLGDHRSGVLAEQVLTAEAVAVALLTGAPATCLEAWNEAAAVKRHTNPYLPPEEQPPPNITGALGRICARAADLELHPMDSDTARRCAAAFEALGTEAGEAGERDEGGEGGEGEGGALSLAAMRSGLLHSEQTRGLCFLASSRHTAAIDSCLRRMRINLAEAATPAERRTVRRADFDRFFAGLSAVACAPADSALEDAEPDADGRICTGSEMMDGLINDPNTVCRRVA